MNPAEMEAILNGIMFVLICTGVVLFVTAIVQVFL